MGPIDYTLNVADPVSEAVRGLQLGATIADRQIALQQHQLQLQQQQDAMRKQQEMQAYVGKLLSNKNASPIDFANATVMYPQLKDQFKQAAEMYQSEQNKGEKTVARQAFAAINNGRADLAEKVYRDRAEELKASGAPQAVVNNAQYWADRISDAPDAAKNTANMLMAAVDPDYVKAWSESRATSRADALAPGQERKVNAEATTAEAKAKYADQLEAAEVKDRAAKLRLTEAQVKDIYSNIGNRASQLGLDRQRLNLEVQKFLFDRSQKEQDIGNDGRKLVNDAAVASGAAKLSAERASDLADKLTSGGYGAFSTFGEWVKKSTGNQDAMTELRAQYTALRNTEGLKNLPPGPATDKDVALAMEGIPPATADARVMQSWLRGVAKMNDISSAVENARADYASSNKGLLGKARSSFTAGGVSVAPGDSWVAVSKKVAEAAARQYTPAADRVQGPSGADLIPGSGTAASIAQQKGATRTVNFSDLK